ncbi:MAG: acyl-CoA dehydrogenase family protein, partial [Rubrobacter sp.]|nr:acyl-CoA dehydrogenase family protein [Rubrobacter sp.]
MCAPLPSADNPYFRAAPGYTNRRHRARPGRGREIPTVCKGERARRGVIYGTIGWPKGGHREDENVTTSRAEVGRNGRRAENPPGHDFLNVEAHLSEGELAVRDRVRSFVRDRIKPNINDWFDRAVFPRELVPEFAELGVLGMHLEGYGCAGRSAVEYGLACMELEAGDSGLRTFVSVQGSLAMSAIHKFGSEEQKNDWL